MAKYRVPLNGYAYATVVVETDETDPEAIVELAYEETPTDVCGHCSGWGQTWSLEIGDEWRASRKEDGTPEFYEESA
ncbi:hypothetical protein [Streptomyces himalayensis]|uniref:Uncharacterized protein n=1 Tax=Streptomyces himalayensis subsp. himalayensis TaxID=2756131 RepID=A0A7W0IDM4_9ACTN|nr:hypothetical protein [Streptomyces himalayensis]MBA2951452.1 hypothetical protein [Streptomyces himalayensis subsp. himalayensis]